MGRNQIDLLLLLSVLLIGSLFYNKNLKEQLTVIKGHCEKAQIQQKKSLEIDKQNLLSISESYPLYKNDIISGVTKLDEIVATASLSASTYGMAKENYQDLYALPPFSELSTKDFKNLAEFYRMGIHEGMNYLDANQKNRDITLEFSMLIESIEQRKDHIYLEIKPYKRYKFSTDLLYALNGKDTINIKGPPYSYCGLLPLTEFAFIDYQGNLNALESINQEKFTP